MTAATVRHDPRVALGSAELRLVYPQLYRHALPGPDHVGAIVTRCELLGADPRGLAERVLVEMRTRGLLTEGEGGVLWPVHARRSHPATTAPASTPEARAAHRRQLAALRSHVRRARDRGDARPRDVLVAEYLAAHPGGGTVTRDDPAETPSDGVTTRGVDPPNGVTGEGVGEGGGLKVPLPPSDSETSENKDHVLSTPACATPTPLPVTHPAVTQGVSVTDPPPPTPPGVSWSDAAGILRGGPPNAPVWFGTRGTDAAKARFEGLLARHAVTHVQLKEMAHLGRAGKLRRQDELAVIDVGLLAPASGDDTLFCSWLNQTDRSLAEKAAAHARDASHRRSLTPNVPRPVQTELGLPANEVPETGPPGAAREGPDPPRAETTTPGPGALKSGITFKPSKVAL